MNPWTIIGWGIVAFVAGAIGWRVFRVVVATVQEVRRLSADLRRSLATAPKVNQRWKWHGTTRRLLDVQPDGSVKIDGDSLQMIPTVLSPERWQAEIRAGRLVAP